MQSRRALVVVVISLFAVPMGACNRTPENPPPSCDDSLCTVSDDDVLLTVVDASDHEAWAYLDLETASLVDVDDPLDEATWDLGFERMVVKSNGGVNGNAGAQVCVLDDTDFDDLLAPPPNCAWRVDAESRPDPRDPGGTVMNDDPWYDYDLVDHTLTAKARRVYIVQTGDGAFFKIQFADYYSSEGVAGWPSFMWSTLAPF
jgi:hypothetical protein